MQHRHGINTNGTIKANKTNPTNVAILFAKQQVVGFVTPIFEHMLRINFEGTFVSFTADSTILDDIRRIKTTVEIMMKSKHCQITEIVTLLFTVYCMIGKERKFYLTHNL